MIAKIFYSNPLLFVQGVPIFNMSNIVSNNIAFDFILYIVLKKPYNIL